MASRQHAIPLAMSAVMIGFGFHQLFNAEKWRDYVPETVADLVSVDENVIIQLHGAGNISLGLLLMFKHKHALVRWMNVTWWFNLVLLCGRHDWREGLRDVPIFIAAFKYATTGKGEQKV